MHLQPVSAGLRGELDGTSERMFDQGLTLPSGSALTDDEFDRIEDAIREVHRSVKRYDLVKRGIDVVVGSVALILSATSSGRARPGRPAQARLAGALPPAPTGQAR